MRASTGEYFVGIDHLRAIAAFLVFSWHFLHVNDGALSALPGTLDFFAFSIFAEGHTGVSLFMVLSGYLFAKLTLGKTINYANFITARAWRLLPLLILVCLVKVIHDFVMLGPEKGVEQILRVAQGVVLPTLPNGGWSITIEFQFYLLFPLIILLERRRAYSSLAIIAYLIVVRVLIAVFDLGPPAVNFMYWSIIGRIDQFILGIIFAYYGHDLARRHGVALTALLALLFSYHWFDRAGGFYGSKEFPDIWLFSIPFEGLLYATLITYYDRSFKFTSTGFSGVVARVGEASYSIYLLHFFVVFAMADFINDNITAIDNIYKGMLFSFLCFIPTVFIGWVSYRRFERYWFRFRPRYSTAAERPGRTALSTS